MDVRYRVNDPEAVFTGSMVNVTRGPLYQVAVAVEDIENKNRDRKVTASLEPGEQKPFELELRQVRQYRVYIDSYSPKTSADLLDEVKGTIPWTSYRSLVKEALVRVAGPIKPVATLSWVSPLRRNPDRTIPPSVYRVAVSWRTETGVPSNVRVTAVLIEVSVFVDNTLVRQPGSLPSYTLTRELWVRLGEEVRFEFVVSVVHAYEPQVLLPRIIDVQFEVTNN